MLKLSEKGAVPVLVLVAAVGLIGFLAVSSSAPFKDKLFAQLFPKRASEATGGLLPPLTISPTSSPISGPINPDTVSPSVDITSPTNGSTVRKNTTVKITTNASDNVAVARVEFFVNGNIRCLVAAAPYVCSWSVPKQPKVKYTITAKAFDASGNSASSSVDVTSK